MASKVNPKDLIDSRDIAEFLGLSHVASVTTYLKRYEDMPRPVIDLGRGRARLWLRSEIEEWVRQRAGSSRHGR